jgi:hypothetical protein
VSGGTYDVQGGVIHADLHGPRGIVIPAPILTRDRALLVGIGRNQAGIESKAFIIRQAGRDGRFPRIFSYPRESQPAEITQLLFRSDT